MRLICERPAPSTFIPLFAVGAFGKTAERYVFVRYVCRQIRDSVKSIEYVFCVTRVITYQEVFDLPVSLIDLTLKHTIILCCSLVFLFLGAAFSNASGIPPPALSVDFDAHSANKYLGLERDFIKPYLFDTVYGGAYHSLDGNGNVLDASKDVIFQANVILLLAGMNSKQMPDPDVKRYLDSSAGFIVRYLEWGPDGPGNWYLSTARNGSNPQPMTWLAPSEAYVSYALLWAYLTTGNQSYLNAAKINIDFQMENFPDGHLMTDVRGHSGDVGYRSPERLAYYTMGQVTHNSSYLEYAKTFQAANYGSNGWEHTYVNGTRVKLYLHGNAVLDEDQYALATGDPTALSEGQQLVDAYWAQGGTGRDYDQDRLAIDLTLWTLTSNEKYRHDALLTYQDLLKFWDPNPPFGFWSDLGKTTKTCFSRGYPLLDLTPPVIVADPEGQKVTAKIVDPTFQWLGLNYSGIGVNPASVYLFYSLDGHSWGGSMLMQTNGGDSYTALVPQDVAARNPLYLISASDYFNNTSWAEFTKPPTTTSVAVASTSTTTPIVIASKTSTTVPLVVAPTSSLGLAFAVIAAGLASAALVVVAGLMYRPARRPMPPAERLGHLVCRCPYWWECYRWHYDCPSCREMRALGGCCMCLPVGVRPGYCNHPPLDYHHVEPQDL